MADPIDLLETHAFGAGDWLEISEVCRVCLIEMPAMVEFVELGVVVSRGPSPDQWLVSAASLPRLRVAGRLMRDLGVNVTGAALAVELLESRGELERQVRRLERLVHS